jgi:hypothetical protein
MKTNEGWAPARDLGKSESEQEGDRARETRLKGFKEPPLPFKG